MAQEKKRLAWLDIAKGICMISVIAGHLKVDWVNRVVFAYHLTVFFLLSGYTLKNNLSWGGVKKRFRSLMLPYGVTCLAVTAMDVVNLLIRGETSAIGKKLVYDLLRSLAASGSITAIGQWDIGGRIGAIWFLPALFFAATGVQLLLRYVKHSPLRYLISLTAAVAAVLSAKVIWLPFSIQSALLAMPVVLLGYDLKQWGLVDKLNWKHFLLGLILYIPAVLANQSKIYYVSCVMSNPVITPVVALASSICVLYLSQKLEGCKSLAWVGRNSVYFLCIHLFEMETLGGAFKWLLTLMGLPYTAGPRFVAKMVFITLSAVLILKWSEMRKLRRR